MLKSIILLMVSLFIAFQSYADKLLLLDSNEDSFKARVDLIKNAQETIRFQYFIMDDDYLTRTQLALLLDAANRGVKVKIIVDSMYNFMRRETTAAMLLSLKPGHEKNVEIKEYNAFNIKHLLRNLKLYKRMHDKSLIIDSKYMISGGRNIANGFFGMMDKKDNEQLPVYEDTDVILFDSDAIVQSANYFDDLWNSKFVKMVERYNYAEKYLNTGSCNHLQRQERASCLAKVRRRITRANKELIILEDSLSTFAKVNSPIAYWENKATTVSNVQYLYDDVKSQNSKLRKPENSIADQLYRFVSEAKESVVITTPYLILTPQQEKLFQDLKSRNVKVTIITNSKAANDVPSAYVGYAKTKKQILESGIELYEYQGPDTLHTKMVLVDMEKFYIGTFNWDYRSQNLNREVGVLALINPNDEEESDDLLEDILSNYAHLMAKSCKVMSNEACVVDPKLNLEDLNDHDISKLMDSNEMREKRKNKLIKILYPLIKKQL